MYYRSHLQMFLIGLSLMTLPFNLYADDSLFSPEGYRIARYRAVTPDAPPAGRRLDTQALVNLISREKPLLIDVKAMTVRPASTECDSSWLPSKERWHIPGSIWLPNVGHGRLEPQMLSYLKSNLARLTDSNWDFPMVFYCAVDCWMSWNTIKRADELGYRNLYWYAEGSDGWEETGFKLVLGQPVPLQGMTESGHCSGQPQ